MDHSIPSGIVGGWLGYQCLRRIGHQSSAQLACTGSAYASSSKLETLLGERFWRAIERQVVLDFGCGCGDEAIEIARRGAARVVGLDIRERVLSVGRSKARQAGLADRCVFTTAVAEPVDVIVSLDAFEHFADPGGVLGEMRRLLQPAVSHGGGRVFISFGPPWFHPYGGHLFSVFPWAHVVFTERALLRWRSDFKHDGATRFREVAGGLNGMTVSRFERLIADSGFEVEWFEAVPIRKLRLPRLRLVRECLTSIVRCELRPR